MIQTNHHPLVKPSSCRGYRLKKLELYNWGTFDGNVFSVRPDGQTTLLIGQNGSGKSTLVDALLTLLVRPGVRNFNVAAGAGKRERDERSYVRGAYDRSGDADGLGTQVKYLRPRDDQYSVILACFHNAATGGSFTVAQLLYLAADQGVQKVYCFSPDERSIQGDFAHLDSTDGIVKTLAARGFRATRKFVEFETWFNKATRVKSKAMEVFNQTVAVKDIQRLNDFIRNHMLEPQSWGEKVDALLGHFTQLSEAHQSLVRVRQQCELLEPVARVGETYRRQASELERSQRLMDAADAFFSHKTVELLAPELERLREQLAALELRKEALSAEIDEARERSRRFQNEIEQAGGDQLREIPLMIRTEQAHADQKRREHGRFHEALGRAGLTEVADDQRAFGAIQQRLPALRTELEDALSRNRADREALILERGRVRHSLAEYREEWDGLNRRRENLPQWCAALRQSLCDDLGLAADHLPFAAELIAVDPEQREWEASIEKVLRGFALSLLVPEKLYHVVSRHVDGTRLADAHGRGRRLVYLRVGEQSPQRDGPSPGPQSLLRKLVFRENHALLPWVKGELDQRFDYRCCDSIEEFQQCRGAAMTPARHVKSGTSRHDKDDRDEAADPRNFVLGWDNREKKWRIAAEIERLEAQESELDGEIARRDRESGELQERLSAVQTASAVASYSEIDFGSHVQEIGELEREKRAIEEQSDTITLLKRRLAEARSKAAALQIERETAIQQDALLNKDIQDAEQLIGNATADLRRREEDGTLARHRESFPELDGTFDPPLTAATLFARQKALERDYRGRIERLRQALRPVEEELLRLMSRFLRDFPDERADLDAGIGYLDSFLGLRQQILEEDLPRHETRFKQRLNEKVIQEVGLFRSELERERRGIQDKIETLNVSLKRLEYRPGTHIQLEPRPVRDPEVVEFQLKLRECIEGSFDDSPEANEERFVRIQQLVQQLSDENNRRWRDKVTDVRRWFDFVASVIDRESLETVSVYQDSSGQSGGEKAKLAFTILVAAIAYQYDLDPDHPVSDRFHFVVVDEMFSKVDDQHAEYALELFKQFGLQLLIVAPLDAKARVTQPYVGCYLHVDKRDNRSEIFEMTAREFEESLDVSGNGRASRLATVDTP